MLDCGHRVILRDNSFGLLVRPYEILEGFCVVCVQVQVSSLETGWMVESVELIVEFDEKVT